VNILAKVFMKGNEVVGEAAVRTGCNIFCGYPITPSSETLEYVSHRFPELGRQFIQAESEVSAMNMCFGAAAAGFRVLTATSGPGIDLKQEALSYIASCELPCVVVDVTRYGSGLGVISQGQSDYLKATKGGGHGDYRLIVYAPNSVQEISDLVELAFDKADEYRNPVMILSDGALGQMMEPVELPEMRECDQEKNKPYALRGKGDGDSRIIATYVYFNPNYDRDLKEKYEKISANEQRWETYRTEDADVILVAFGISSRVCKEAVRIGRERGVKLGLFRPISLYPFPRKALADTAATAKGYLSVEMSALGQLVEDVALSIKGRRPVYLDATGMKVPDAEEIIKRARDILNGSAQEVF
jgi:2-oxoglutarate ferredoxin oxidoreductase subunit alpha